MTGYKIREYYRTKGDTAHVRKMERAVDDEWRSTKEMAERIGVSPGWAYQCLQYLWEEKRVRRGRMKLKRPFYGNDFKWMWKRR